MIHIANFFIANPELALVTLPLCFLMFVQSIKMVERSNKPKDVKEIGNPVAAVILGIIGFPGMIASGWMLLYWLV